MSSFRSIPNLRVPTFQISALLIYFQFGLFNIQAIESGNLHLNRNNSAADPVIQIMAELDPVRISPGGRLTLRLIGRVNPGNHLYSIKSQGEFAPKPTRLIVTSDFLTPVSETTESEPILIIDNAFEMPLQVHNNDFWISRQYRVSSRLKPGSYPIRGYLLYQICSHRICSLPLKSRFNEPVKIIN